MEAWEAPEHIRKKIPHKFLGFDKKNQPGMKSRSLISCIYFFHIFRIICSFLCLYSLVCRIWKMGSGGYTCRRDEHRDHGNGCRTVCISCDSEHEKGTDAGEQCHSVGSAY